MVLLLFLLFGEQSSWLPTLRLLHPTSMPKEPGVPRRTLMSLSCAAACAPSPWHGTRPSPYRRLQTRAAPLGRASQTLQRLSLSLSLFPPPVSPSKAPISTLVQLAMMRTVWILLLVELAARCCCCCCYLPGMQEEEFLPLQCRRGALGSVSSFCCLSLEKVGREHLSLGSPLAATWPSSWVQVLQQRAGGERGVWTGQGAGSLGCCCSFSTLCCGQLPPRLTTSRCWGD